MTWGNRLKLIVGMLLVLVVVVAATLVFNQRQTKVLSASAQIKAERYDVGTDYGGIVLERYAEEGDTVAEGERLYAIESIALARDIAQGLVPGDALTLTEDGAIVVRSPVDGTVTAAAVDVGAFASAGGVIGAVERAGTLFVEAEFVLAPSDFGRVEDAAAVELWLPDGRTLHGTVESISVQTIEGDAHVSARIVSTELATSEGDGLMTTGTPLEATLHLRDDGPLAGVTEALGDLARKVGL